MDLWIALLIGVVLVAVAAALGASTAVLIGRRRWAAARPDPVPAELAELRRLVAELSRDGAERQGRLEQSLEEQARRTAEVAGSARNLEATLVDRVARGQWGERLADDVLRAAGFVEGVNYVRQRGIDTGGRPDVTFLLPGDAVLHMDVKFPVDNYLRAGAATDPEQGRAATAAFVRDVRAHVDEVSRRGYAGAEGALGHVLLFVPNEAVYAFAHEHDPELVDHALGHGVVLCSPLTLFAVLAVVRHAVDAFQLEQRSDAILDVLAGFDDQWRRYAASLDRVARALDSAHRSFDELTGTRRNQLERALDAVTRLRRDPARPTPEMHLVEASAAASVES